MSTETEERRIPTWEDIAQKMREVAKDRHQWAGIPVPIDEEHPMVIEPRYPYRLDKFYGESSVKVCTTKDVDESAKGWQVVNQWHNKKLGATVLVMRNEHGRAMAGYIPNGHGERTAELIGDIAASTVWLIDAEIKATEKLCSLISHHKGKQYLMSGSFLETSKRSGVTYLFRRLRPTIAMRPAPDGNARVLCTLCLHPIGYYRQSHAGCMVPTDDVIAQLVMMRGDEPKFWANANQHAPDDPNSGI